MPTGGSCRKLIVVAIGSIAVACGAEDDPSLNADEVTVESRAAPLNGSVEYEDSSCDEYTSLIDDAFAFAVDNLWRPEMEECAQAAILSGTLRSPEYALAQLRQDMPTRVNCADIAPAVGKAPLGIANERLTLDLGHLSTQPSPVSIATLSIHELSHNKGYTHAGDSNDTPLLRFGTSLEHRYTLPLQLAACFRSVADGLSPPIPNNTRRDGLGDEATLAPIGSSGGVPFQLPCALPAGGVQVRAGALVDAIGLSCLGFVQPREPTALAGGSGGSPSTLACASNEILVGVHGRADETLIGIGALCASTDSVKAKRRVASEVREVGWRGAASGGTTFRRWCPAGMAVLGIRGKAGQYVDRLEVECRRVNHLAFGTESDLAWTGGSGGTLMREKCAGRAALVGITAQAGNVVDRLGGMCSVVSTVCEGGACTERVGSSRHMLPAYGGWGGLLAEQRCRTGEAVVGLEMHAGWQLDAISPICAAVQAWSSSSGAAPTVGYPRIGGSGGSLVISTCPRGAFVTGWSIRADNFVRAVQPICRDFQ